MQSYKRDFREIAHDEIAYIECILGLHVIP